MAKFCLTRDQADKFIKGLRSGEIDAPKMADMTSEDRHAYIEKFVGKENATQVNSLFESKLLLKNQQRGMISWAKKVAGLTPEVKRDLITRIGKLDKVLNPEEEKSFLKDLASTKIGADVTPQEAKNIFDLSNKVKETKAHQQSDGTFKTNDQRMAYGRAKVALGNYVNELKGNNKITLKSVADIGGLTKSIRASMDNSAIFRQGWKTLMTHPGTWLKNAANSFVDIVKTVGDKPVLDEITADIISRPNYDLYTKAKLATATIEEAYPSSLPEKIPALGRLYKASEIAYTGFLHRMRADVFDKYIEVAKNSGVDLTDKELQSIGKLVNSLTGRGDLGKFEPGANLVNSVFFSPRSLKAEVDTFLQPLTGAGGSNFVRKQAAVNLVKVIAGTATVMAVANALKPGSVETDPRSSDFGKIKIGNTRFDITGGLDGIVTLAARLATMSSKSSTTGKVTQLNSGQFGSQTGTDVIVNFFENKLSPVLSVLKDITTGKDFNGNKITIPGELQNLFVPLSISNYQELKNDPHSANTILAMIADGLGISTNTYGQTVKQWSQSPTKEQSAFLRQVGNAKFNQANKDFNAQYDNWFSKTSQTTAYKNLSSNDKQTLLTTKKEDLQAKVFKSYGFTYKPVRQSKQQIQQHKATINKLL